jgi:hypothetical protein
LACAAACEHRSERRSNPKKGVTGTRSTVYHDAQGICTCVVAIAMLMGRCLGVRMDHGVEVAQHALNDSTHRRTKKGALRRCRMHCRLISLGKLSAHARVASPFPDSCCRVWCRIGATFARLRYDRSALRGRTLRLWTRFRYTLKWCIGEAHEHLNPTYKAVSCIQNPHGCEPHHPLRHQSLQGMS